MVIGGCEMDPRGSITSASSEDMTVVSDATTTTSHGYHDSHHRRDDGHGKPEGKKPFGFYDDESSYAGDGEKFAGVPMDSDETEEEDGVVVFHKVFGRKVARHGTTVIKSGKSITTSEAEALRLAERLRLPTPRVQDVSRDNNGDLFISMDYVEGDVLEDVWPAMTDTQKRGVARQLRSILYAMRAAPPPPGATSYTTKTTSAAKDASPASSSLSPVGSRSSHSWAVVKASPSMTSSMISLRGDSSHSSEGSPTSSNISTGISTSNASRSLVVRTSPKQPKIASCSGGPIRDAHHYFDYHGGPFTSEEAFNTFLLSGLQDDVPPVIASALSARMRTDHRVVFTHGDLTQRNILVREGKIVALLDWEYAGWYPEYWEYVKFLGKDVGRFNRDWRAFAGDIFPTGEGYGEELVGYVALTHWQRP